MTDTPPKDAPPQTPAPPSRRDGFDDASPYDKPSLSAKQRKAYERKVLNIGLVVIMLVVTGLGIAAHQFFRGLDRMIEKVSDADIGMAETPFSPPPAAAPAPRAPTNMALPGMDVPHDDARKRRIVGRIAQLVSQSGSDSPDVLADTPLFARVQFFMPEAKSFCTFHQQIEPDSFRAGDTVTVEYSTDVPDMCGSSKILTDMP